MPDSSLPRGSHSNQAACHRIILKSSCQSLPRLICRLRPDFGQSVYRDLFSAVANAARCSSYSLGFSIVTLHGWQDNALKQTSCLSAIVKSVLGNNPSCQQTHNTCKELWKVYAPMRKPKGLLKYLAMSPSRDR